MLNKDKILFLLGGHDLEMIEIKEMLEAKEMKYIDNNLSWGATLSSYEDYLSFDGTIYGIELEENITPSKNYIEIDHHNNNSHKPSSLEQVAELLNINLNRHQLLVAQNDSRHIEGMKSIGATKKEIAHIRALDRAAQGITPEDERLAELSIQETKNSNIFKSKTEKFSALSDKIYDKFQNYIIYNEMTLSFYGYKIIELIEFLKEHGVCEDDFYYGGGDFGFLGLKSGYFSTEKIKKLIEEFREMQEKLYSYHMFMLPFRYETKDKEHIVKSWKPESYSMSYNEKAYFHDFFIDSMEGATHYTREFSNDEFIISKSQEYRLTLDKTSLRLFEEANIGILTINLKNTKYPEVASILEINDFTRRLYPEYLDYENRQSGLVPEFVKFDGVLEEFAFDAELKEPKLSKIINHFIPTQRIKPAVDDRMFVISFYENSELANDLKEDYTHNERWYEYVFIDGSGKTVQNEQMQTSLINRASYARWQGYGTMYGISKYSFVALANSDFPLQHMQSIYFEIFSLLLMVRSTILKFSSEVSEIANHLGKKDIAGEVEDIYTRYIQFVNSFYFREITAKDQGLELYEKALDILNIQRDIKDLDDEIEELHKFVELQREKEAEKEAEKTNKKLNTITLYGGVMLGASLLTSLFGMNVGGDGNFSGWIVYPAIAISFFVGYRLVKKGES